MIQVVLGSSAGALRLAAGMMKMKPEAIRKVRQVVLIYTETKVGGHLYVHGDSFGRMK